jgi:eukaryotic-like serine/threonine-protein kinase
MAERDIFIAALQKEDPAERQAYLDVACAGQPELRQQVEHLLRLHEGAGSFLEQPAAESAATRVVPDAALEASSLEASGALIGPYKLIEQIGEGGMGTVWMAQQTEPVKRLVAVKLIKAGMDSRQVIARFEAERQALALMDHANIARVLEAGTTGASRPYFVMDLVKGVPITRYCDEHHLTPRQRLELFIPVCQAVQHAHQKGIIHRDLKPSNVLVALYDGKPVPKVIDFGVAKAAGQALTEKTLVTGFGNIVGTLEYMSPEQAEINQLDIDTRSDIYSLGVLLYELLTGSPPFSRKDLEKAGMLEMLRVIREQEPTKPSTKLSTAEGLPTLAANRGTEPAKLTKLVRGELDWIVMKALEKDRSRRYETANGLAVDIQRYLTDEPVLAGPPSNTYRMRKFARKNRKLLVAAAVVGVLLVTTTLASIWAAVQSARLAETEHELRGTAEQRADAERKAKEEIEWSFYLHRIARAQQELLAENTGRAEELLDECPALLRGWEWHYLKRSRPGNPLSLKGNLSAALSPDGRYLALENENVDIVDAATGRRVRTLRGVTSFIESWGMAFYPKAGETILAAGDFRDKVVRLWNVDTGQEIRTLRGHGDRLRTVAFSPDGQRLVAGSVNRGAKVWDWRTGQLMFEVSKPPKISRIAYSADGRRVAVGGWGDEKDVIVYDAASWREIRSFGKHKGGIEAVAYSPNGEHVATSGSDGLVNIWKESSGALELTLSGHTGTVHDVAYAPDGRRLASVGWDKTLKLWDTETGKETLTLRAHTDEVCKVVFSPDGHRLLSAGKDSVKVWNATPVGEMVGSEALSLPGHTSFVTSVAFSPDGRLLASAGSDRLIKVWEVASLGQGTPPKGLTLEGHTDRILSLAFSPDSRRLASAGWGGDIKTWNAAAAREILTVPAGDDLRIVAFSPDGRFLASLGPGRLDVWNANTGEHVMVIPMPNGELHAMAYSPDGKYVALGQWHDVRIWDMGTAKEVRSFNHSGLVQCVAYSPDGRRVASASFDQTVKIWDPKNGNEIRTLRGHADRVVSVAFGPNGKRLASGSADSTVKLWNAATGREIGTLRGHTGYVWSVAFSPDGTRLASGGGHQAKGEVKVWDLTRLEHSSDPAAPIGQQAIEAAPK